MKKEMPIRDLETLKARLMATWDDLLSNSRFVRTIKSGEATRTLYALYLVETFHYTRHNARNQALVGVRMSEDDRHYQKFCFDHATAEVGHELLALHDLVSLGLERSPILPPPLPATEILIAYLYWISYQGNPLQRLGYSYWAESCYNYVRPLLRTVQQTLGLTTTQMTFFIAHAEIDAEHSRLVNSMISKKCADAADWDAVAKVMETSLRLTGRMMDEVHDEYIRLVDGQTERCAFLKALPA
jgi:pyrroloquinoline quinone (PQQ) biosynthesis protein C